jgi:hypothetical protein
MKNKIYQHAGNHDDYFDQNLADMKMNPVKYFEPSIEEQITYSINFLYSLIDIVFDERKNLINRKETTKSNYESFNQTIFGEHLAKYLKKIAKNCDRYITKLFANRNDSKWFSAIDCQGANDISELYNYLKDEKFTEESLKKADLEELMYRKANLKKTLKSYLVKINQYRKEKNFIENLKIPIDNGIKNWEWTPPSPPTVYNKEMIKYIDRINKHNVLSDAYREDFVDKNGYNPWENPRHAGIEHGVGGEKQSGSGNTKITKTIKKEILGKERCIYKKSGDRKEYVKHKGDLITVSEYKKIMIAKNKK